MLIVNNNCPVRLLINHLGHHSDWLGLRLVERPGGRDAYGAKVGLRLADGRALWRRVRAPASYCSSNDPRVLIGLGTASPIHTLEVHWPDGTRELWDGSAYPINRYYTLEKGTGRVLP